ncbi:hypothetical protein [Paenibacillus campi]|uniref:hypothetical protein n=1 Tax=Paenibacillus campi TaxID=3106031 RepID=UPI002AFED858|nr:hypothetical protein [Paenibacillus sp. SGZ-1009]
MKSKSRTLTLLLVCLSLIFSFGMAPTSTFAATAKTTKTPAADLRATAAKVFGEHSYLAMLVMQKQFNQAKDTQQALDALNANTNSIASLLTGTYTDQAAAELKAQWNTHNQRFSEYAVAMRDKNTTNQQGALASIKSATSMMVTILKQQNPYINEQQLLKDLTAHNNSLIRSFDAYAKGQYGTTYSEVHNAYVRASTVGASLATATTKRYPSRFKQSTTQTDAAYFRQKTGEALGEHAILSILVMQKGNDNAPDLPNVKAALNRNTDALTATHKLIFGTATAQTFNTLWNRHINDYVMYLNATLAGDTAKRQAAKTDLGGFVADLTAFQTGRLPSLNKTATYQANAMHGAHVITAFDSYHNGDYAKSYEALRTGYNHMWKTANTLSEAIVKRYPAKF